MKNSRVILSFTLAVFSVIIISLILYALFKICFFRLQNSYVDNQLSLEYNIFYYIAITIVTLCLAIIAWVQLGNITSNSQVAYLLEFDKKWGSEELINARAIIHKQYVEYQRISLSKEDMFDALGKYITDLSMTDKKPDDVKNFMYVLSLLNFFEAVGFIYNKTNLKAANINDLMGQSIKFYYKVFNRYIEHRRNKHDDDNFHKEFQEMFKSIDG